MKFLKGLEKVPFHFFTKTQEKSILISRYCIYLIQICYLRIRTCLFLKWNWRHSKCLCHKFDCFLWDGGAWGGGLKMLSKNTCKGVHFIVKLQAISLPACKFFLDGGFIFKWGWCLMGEGISFDGGRGEGSKNICRMGGAPHAPHYGKPCYLFPFGRKWALDRT